VNERAAIPRLPAALGGQPVDGVEVTRGAVVVSGARGRWYSPSSHDLELAALETTGAVLGDRFETHQGVVSGADDLFILTREAAAELDLNERERALLRHVVRARHIRPFDFDGSERWMLHLDGSVPIEQLPAIHHHLAPHRERLSRRREVRSGSMPWYRLHWPRRAGLFARPRIITPRRSTSPRFAMGRPGYCEQSDVALITHPDDDVAALEALLRWLNGPEVALWCRWRGKQKGQVREYFGRSLEEIPLPGTQ